MKMQALYAQFIVGHRRLFMVVLARLVYYNIYPTSSPCFDNRNNDDIGELSDPGTDSRSIFDCYLDISDDDSESVNPEDELCTVL